jgi:NifU-like protein
MNTLTLSFPWSRYSKKLTAKILNPRSIGVFSKEEADQKNLRLVTGKEGRKEDGNFIRFYWLVDKEDGGVVDARFQVFGQSALIGGADAACDIIVGKNYDQARRITSELIDKSLRDKETDPAFPKETIPHLSLIISAIEDCAEQCMDLPLPSGYISMPKPQEFGEVLENGIPGWFDFPLKQKLSLIEEVLDRDIRPYIAMDAGGVEVINLIEGKEVVITYSGSCTSCYSSIGTTLNYIQQVLRAKVHPTIKVTPNVDFT